MKSMFKSKTMWFNGLTLLAGFLVVMQDTTWLMDSYSGVILGVVGLVNLGLRLVTSEPLK